MSSGEHQDAASAKVDDTAADRVTNPARPLRAVSAPEPDPGPAQQHVQAALAAGTRTGASLSALFRAVEQMTDGLSGAREANEQLVGELRAMHEALVQRTAENASLEDQLAALTSERDNALGELEQLRHDAAQEHEFLLEEQDRFLAALLEDHEQALSALRRELDEGRTGPVANERDMATDPGMLVGDAHRTDTARELLDARRTIEKLMTERTRSREMLRRLQAQRDEAQAALATAQRDAGALNVVVHTAPAKPNPDAVITEPPHQAVATKNNPPSRQGRTTDPQGPLARAADDARSDRKTDPLPRSALARALEASRPSEGHDALEAPTPPGPIGAVAGAAPVAPQQRTITTPGLAAPTPTPDELKSALTTPTSPHNKPALKRKPDPATRSIGGYSLGRNEVESDRIEGTPPDSPKPPRR